MSNKDRSKRGKTGKFNGSDPGPTKIPVAPVASRIPVKSGLSQSTPAGDWLLSQKISSNFTQEVFERLMNFNYNIGKMDRSLFLKLCHEFEIGLGDAAIFNNEAYLKGPTYKDQTAREEARDVAWKYAENESSNALGFAQVYISKAGANESGYIVRDALQAVLTKDKISPRIYNALMKRWIELVGNDDIQNDNISAPDGK